MNSDLSDTLKSLVARYLGQPDGMPWPEKRALAERILRERRELGIPESQTDLRRVVLSMARDAKWEVRRMAAEMLPLLPDEDFKVAAADLAADTNAYVKRTAERGLGQRRQAAKAARKVRKAVNQVDEMIGSMERQFGALAAGRVRKICDKHATLVVGPVAHDLNNSLTRLKKGVTEHLESCSGAKPDSAAKIMEDFAFLEGQISDMSRYAQQLTDEMALEDFGCALRTGAEMARSALEDRGCDISSVAVSLETEVDLQVEMARRLVVLSASHIVKNAIEAFSRPDGTFESGEVCIRAERQDSQVVATFSNNGPGLDENDLADLRSFLPGRKNKTKRTSRGFGLPTAHRYILHHGGSIEIDSPGGEGAVVTVRLPITQDQRIDG